MEHGMDKHKEEMNIYANVHSVNFHDVRTETENTRKHQTLQHSGTATHFITTTTTTHLPHI